MLHLSLSQLSPSQLSPSGSRSITPPPDGYISEAGSQSPPKSPVPTMAPQDSTPRKLSRKVSHCADEGKRDESTSDVNNTGLATLNKSLGKRGDEVDVDDYLDEVDVDDHLDGVIAPFMLPAEAQTNVYNAISKPIPIPAVSAAAPQIPSFRPQTPKTAPASPAPSTGKPAARGYSSQEELEAYAKQEYERAFAYEATNPAQAVRIYEALIQRIHRPESRMYPGPADRQVIEFTLDIIYVDGRDDIDRSMFQLALLYKNGAPGVPANPQKSFKLLSDLIGFHLEARFVLAQLYEEGLGVAKNIAKAKHHYSKIASFHGGAAARLAALERS